MHALTPCLQWQPNLIQSVTLDFKREWISKQICLSGSQQGVVEVVIRREGLLDGLCERLEASSTSLRMGISVRFDGDGETGSGDGHRREFFCKAAEEQTHQDCRLFKSNDGCRSFHISSTASDAQPDHIASRGFDLRQVATVCDSSAAGSHSL